MCCKLRIFIKKSDSKYVIPVFEKQSVNSELWEKSVL